MRRGELYKVRKGNKNDPMEEVNAALRIALAV